jgi:hypothetical protein
MTNIRPSDLYAVHSVKHNQCRPVSTLRLHLQLGKRGPHSGPAAGALRAISAGRGATRQLLCSVCTAGAHRRAAPQRGSASRSSSTLLGEPRASSAWSCAPLSAESAASVRSVRCDTPLRHGRCSSASAAKCGPWTQTVTSSRHSQCGHSESHSSSGSPAGCRSPRPPCGSRRLPRPAVPRWGWWACVDV